MKYLIEHINTYHYETTVDQSMNTIRLKPRADECQHLQEYRAMITPASLTREHMDLWGNHVETFFIPEQHKQLEVKALSIITIQKSPLIHQIDYSQEMKNIFYSDMFHKHYRAYLMDTGLTYLNPEQIAQVTREVGRMENPVQYALDVMNYVNKTFTYGGDVTNVATRAMEAFDLKKGVCQDFSHIMLGILHAQYIPARYVSGYLYIGEDSALKGDGATHAWVEVMVPGIGWIGLDPTNNIEALAYHVRVGAGRDYGDVSPMQGVYRGGSHTLDVKVSVTLLEL
ncbi:MAG: transglutaminase family protein [Gorillibacterium sp.]|nr:transglutaminase family protein [Gorillibacterium sp.]